MNGLEKNFREKLETAFAYSEKAGFKIDVFSGLRSLKEQAQLWKQSRTEAQILKLHGIYLERGMKFCAEVLMSTPYVRGRWATNKAPGYSWHQYGEAVDFVLIYRQNALWNKNNPAYREVADLIKNEGLTTGYYWEKQDVYHIQLRSAPVQNEYSYEAIDGMMRERYAS